MVDDHKHPIELGNDGEFIADVEVTVGLKYDPYEDTQRQYHRYLRHQYLMALGLLAIPIAYLMARLLIPAPQIGNIYIYWLYIIYFVFPGLSLAALLIINGLLIRSEYISHRPPRPCSFWVIILIADVLLAYGVLIPSAGYSLSHQGTMAYQDHLYQRARYQHLYFSYPKHDDYVIFECDRWGIICRVQQIIEATGGDDY